MSFVTGALRHQLWQYWRMQANSAALKSNKKTEWQQFSGVSLPGYSDLCPIWELGFALCLTLFLVAFHLHFHPLFGFG